VRYTSPRPDGSRPELYTASPRRGNASADARQAPASPEKAPNGIKMEPDHLASLTAEQRADLRLWHGRVNLLQRVKAMRGYAVLTLGAVCLSIAGVVIGVDDVPPLVAAPIIPLFMGMKL